MIFKNRQGIFIKEIIKKEIQFEQECPDEVIGTIAYDKDKGKFEGFKRRDDYDQTFVGLDQHDAYFKSIQQEIKGRILIILESPHKDEFGIQNLKDYFSENKITARPANGQTGINIKNHLAENLNKNIDKIRKIVGGKFNESGIYSVSLLNAVPYQCSLGEDPLFYRDECFLKMWSIEEIRNDFITRLGNFAPDLIINACTKGKRYIPEGDNLKGKFLTKKFVKSINLDMPMWDKAKGFLLQNLVQHQIPEAYKNKTISTSHPSSSHFCK